MYYILNANGDICGESRDHFTPAEGLRLIAKADYHPDPLLPHKPLLRPSPGWMVCRNSSAIHGRRKPPKRKRGRQIMTHRRRYWQASRKPVACRWMTCAPRRSPKATPTPRSPRPSPDSGRR